MALRSKQKLLLVATEGSNYGVDGSLAAANQVYVNDDISISPLNGPTVQRNIIRGYRGAYQTSLANEQSAITFSVEFAGSGTAGVAPAYASLLRSCGLAQTITASALTGSAVAGSAGSITLAAGSSAVNRFYCGQIISITSGAGNGASGLIVDYNGTTKVAAVVPITSAFVPAASSAYSIAPNVSFRPISTVSGVSDTSTRIAWNADGLERRMVGVRGTAAISLPMAGFGGISFTMTGIDAGGSDAPQSSYGALSEPAQATPLIYRADSIRATRFAGHSGCYNNIGLEFGNTVSYKERINCTKEVRIDDGMSTGTVAMEATLQSVFDPFTLMKTDNASPGPLSTLLYGAAGNRMALVVPGIDIVSTTITGMEGDEMFNVNYSAIPTAAGNDDWYLVCS